MNKKVKKISNIKYKLPKDFKNKKDWLAYKRRIEKKLGVKFFY